MRWMTSPGRKRGATSWISARACAARCASARGNRAAGSASARAAGSNRLAGVGQRSLASTSRSSPRATARSSASRARPPSCATAKSSSARTGTAISAAAVGVGARRSAAKSISVVSVSCPTALISGIGDSAAARTTASSLKAHRSSIEPPPRATISRSGLLGIAPNPRIAAAILGAAPSPCTGTGQTMTCVGQRSASRCRMSRITAPVGLVTTPMVRGRNGSRRLRPSSNKPSAASAFRRLSSSAINAPSPASSSLSTTIWYLDRPG